ncbi:hypothetical protein TEA_028746 [Camellia sinensis var. sinensis]|uniref:Uncharacterized protein n=1 Tax=Camellia sinensis var. sinensis TaxID=542762 RepID=A0A4S4D4Z5_CAMSN|nr:hypothetical protein TEA_028746 [Camellia sinensis var. sinensis]
MDLPSPQVVDASRLWPKQHELSYYTEMCDTLGKATWGLFKCEDALSFLMFLCSCCCVSFLTTYAVSDNLLHDASSNQETLIFCSQTLRSKVQRDFEELSSEAFRPLRDLLNVRIFIELIENISQRPPLKLEPRIPASTLASHPLVLTALSSLNSDILSEASVNGTMIDTN